MKEGKSRLLKAHDRASAAKNSLVKAFKESSLPVSFVSCLMTDKEKVGNEGICVAVMFSGFPDLDACNKDLPKEFNDVKVQYFFHEYGKDLKLHF